VGWHPRERFWSFPERDAAGNVIGIMRRFEDGTKKRWKGSKAGLTYAYNQEMKSGPILLVEGASDTAALMTVGLAAIGRPSNAGGVSHLIDLLLDEAPDRPIFVIGERDQKLGGSWPGKTGAISTAIALAEALERPIRWGFPPDGAKDSRAWLMTMPPLPVDRLVDLYVTGLDTQVIAPPLTIHTEVGSIPTVSLETWRDNMLAVRLLSLERPGIYLDRSPTGAGKSYVDVAAVLKLLRQEAVA
jgi:hypothetical protein